jgi:hypothetical protein
MVKNIQRTKKVLNIFQGCFQQNPFDFLYEFDIHAQLYVMLRNEFKDLSIKCKFGGSKPIDFSIVRGTYHPGSKNRPDIAILQDREIIQRPLLHQRPGDKNEMFLYWQKVDIAIELKLRPMDSNRTQGFLKDLERLDDLRKIVKDKEENQINTGIAILFFHRNRDLKNLISKHNRFSEFLKMETISPTENHTNGFLVSPDMILGHTLK